MKEPQSRLLQEYGFIFRKSPCCDSYEWYHQKKDVHVYYPQDDPGCASDDPICVTDHEDRKNYWLDRVADFATESEMIDYLTAFKIKRTTHVESGLSKENSE